MSDNKFIKMENIYFIKDDNIIENFIFYYIKLESPNNDICIGACEGYLNNEILVLIIRINEEFRCKGYGYEGVKKILEYFEEENIKHIAASWNRDEEYSYCKEGMSTNLLIFKEMQKKGHDTKESIYATPTGRWMAKLGYKNYTIIKDNKDCVDINFFK